MHIRAFIRMCEPVVEDSNDGLSMRGLQLSEAFINAITPLNASLSQPPDHGRLSLNLLGPASTPLLRLVLHDRVILAARELHPHSLGAQRLDLLRIVAVGRVTVVLGL